MGALIGAVIAIGTLAWAITRLLDGASDAKFAWRRFKWMRKSTKPVSQTITDPREAAAVVMLQVVSYNGMLTQEDLAAVKSALMEEIAPLDQEAGDLIAVARVVLNEIGDANGKVRQLSQPVKAVCSPEEKTGLISQMMELAERQGEASDVQKQFIDRYKRALFD